MINALPSEIIFLIFDQLDYYDLIRLKFVCKNLAALTPDEKLLANKTYKALTSNHNFFSKKLDLKKQEQSKFSRFVHAISFQETDKVKSLQLIKPYIEILLEVMDPYLSIINRFAGKQTNILLKDLKDSIKCISVTTPIENSLAKAYFEKIFSTLKQLKSILVEHAKDRLGVEIKAFIEHLINMEFPVIGERFNPLVL